jgi:hypothetical protein
MMIYKITKVDQIGILLVRYQTKAQRVAERSCFMDCKRQRSTTYIPM